MKTWLFSFENIWRLQIKSVPLPLNINDKLMVHVNETIVIKSDSPKLAEWVKKMKAYKAEQLERMRNSHRCDFMIKY